eukprot:TRINITY_DN5177_c0_g1_i1.p1 TRINITY_DN5177_c0_g1~~TRINITY_DN5177_c0_g1_i1.p1  ORF type:complete len:282 (+),score=69.44 TRINITY_DN5177_c0_g1_i1:197-1042(+)
MHCRLLCSEAPSPGGGRSSAAAAMAALQRFAAAEQDSATSAADQAMAFEEHMLKRASAEEAAKQTAFRLKNSPLAKNAAESSAAGGKQAGPRYTGIIKAFSTVQGFGFIQSREMTNLYGCDAFLNQAVEGGIVIGGTVSFSVEMNKDGKPQARNVVLEDSTPKPIESAKPKGGNLNYSGYPMGGPMSNHMGHMGQMGMGNPMQAKDLAGKVFKGRVKSFNSNRGFGFIFCSDLQYAFGGRDVYVGVNQVPNGVLPVGKEYEFQLSIDRQGQPQAKELRPLS